MSKAWTMWLLVVGVAAGCGDGSTTTSDGSTGGGDHSEGGAAAGSGAGGESPPPEPSSAITLLPETMNLEDDGVGTPLDTLTCDVAALEDGRLAILFADGDGSTHVRYVDPDGVVSPPVDTPANCPSREGLALHPSGEVTLGADEIVRLGVDGQVRWTRPTSGQHVTAAGEGVVVTRSFQTSPASVVAEYFDADGNRVELDGYCPIAPGDVRTTYGGSPPRVWVFSAGGACSVDVKARVVEQVPLAQLSNMVTYFSSVDVGTDGSVYAVQDDWGGDGDTLLWKLPGPEPLATIADSGALLDEWGIPPHAYARFIHSSEGWTTVRSRPYAYGGQLELIHGDHQGTTLDVAAFPGQLDVRGVATAGDQMWVVGVLEADSIQIGDLSVTREMTGPDYPYVALRVRDWHSVLALQASQ